MSDKVARLLLRPAEVAESLGIGRSKVYELISSGQLPSIRIGGSLRVPIDKLTDWLEQGAAGADRKGSRSSLERRRSWPSEVEG